MLLGWIAEGRPRLRDRPYPRLSVELADGAPLIRPPLVKIAMDDDGWWLPAVRQAPGLVVEGTGGGHVPGWLSDDLVELAGRIPVVMTSRTGAGEVLTATYGGFRGSETVLLGGGSSQAEPSTGSRPGCCWGCCSVPGPTTTGSGAPSPRRARSTAIDTRTTAEVRRIPAIPTWSSAAAPSSRTAGPAPRPWSSPAAGSPRCSTPMPATACAATRLDATGRLVLPGGVDPHCHVGFTSGRLHLPGRLPGVHHRGRRRRHDHDRGLRHPPSPARPRPTSRATQRAKAPHGLCDSALHACVVEWDATVAEQLASWSTRPRTVKMFTTYRGEIDGRRGHHPADDGRPSAPGRHGDRALRGQPPHRGSRRPRQAAAGRICGRRHGRHPPGGWPRLALGGGGARPSPSRPAPPSTSCTRPRPQPWTGWSPLGSAG